MTSSKPGSATPALRIESLGIVVVLTIALGLVVPLLWSSCQPAGPVEGPVAFPQEPERDAAATSSDSASTPDTLVDIEPDSGSAPSQLDGTPSAPGRARRDNKYERFKATAAFAQLRQDVLDAFCPALEPGLDGYLILSLEIGAHTTNVGRDELRAGNVSAAGMGSETFVRRGPLEAIATEALVPYLDGERDFPAMSPLLRGGQRMRIEFAECRELD